MATRLNVDHGETVVLTESEKLAWEQFLQRHRDEVRGEMYRALFDDVRPAWEEYFAKKEAAGEGSATPRKETPNVTDDIMAGMFRALFDDVRPAWEEYFAKKEAEGQPRGVTRPASRLKAS